MNAELVRYLALIALCEVILKGKLKDIEINATLQDVEAIIVRFVFQICYGDDDNANYYEASVDYSLSKNIHNIGDVLRFLEARENGIKIT